MNLFRMDFNVELSLSSYVYVISNARIHQAWQAFVTVMLVYIYFGDRMFLEEDCISIVDL